MLLEKADMNNLSICFCRPLNMHPTSLYHRITSRPCQHANCLSSTRKAKAHAPIPLYTTIDCSTLHPQPKPTPSTHRAQMQQPTLPPPCLVSSKQIRGAQRKQPLPMLKKLGSTARCAESKFVLLLCQGTTRTKELALDETGPKSPKHRHRDKTRIIAPAQKPPPARRY